MKSWKKPTNELINKALQSTKKMTARKYFFSRLENPLWLKPLVKRGRFQSPPKGQRFDDGTIQFPYWPEIQYLKNVCREATDEVIGLLLKLPEVDNPIVYDGILDIALQLPGKQSAKLKPKILEYARIDHQLWAHKYTRLLAHWTRHNQTSAALELSEILVDFAPDPQSEDKQKRRKKDPMDTNTLLESSPQMKPSDYREIMLKRIRPLAEDKPYKVACILIDATANMIRLRRHQVDLDKEEDVSQSWCPCLHGSDRDYGSSEEILAHTLTFACEKVFEKLPDAVEALDKVLRKQHWKIFKRLRHHLYAQYPNQQTKPWILELILTPEYYNRWKHSYEFQLMIRHACEHFGETLLTKKERALVFDAILAGPSKANYQEWVMGWLGQEFTEEGFQQHLRYCHRMQFTPFAPVLFGKYETYYLQELEPEVPYRIFDEDYLPSKVEVSEISVSKHSPRSSEDLANLTDEALLIYINQWENEDKLYEDDRFIEINIEALANVFQTVFKESIIPDANRLGFWMENSEKIERPIYVRAMMNEMEAHVKAKNFYQLNEWLTFSESILSHPDQKHEGDYRQGDKSRVNPNWSYARRAVGDFIGTCLEKDVDVPFYAREQLAELLETLSTQFDRRLDHNVTSNDPLTEGINSTRGRALENLIKFGVWLRRGDSACEVPEVTEILEKRFAPEAECPLTLPEYAILGKNYPSICGLNETWTVKHKSGFFPQEDLPAWLAAFSSFVLCNRSIESIFNILREDFNFALQHLADFKNRDRGGHEPIDVLGQRLFTYYLSDMYPLKGEESLLGRFYQLTNNDREHWANLFNDIGHRLWNTGKHLNQGMKNRVKEFFEWRFKQEEPTELQHFTFWLEAECLDTEWRLDAYAKILDVCKVEGASIRLETLCKVLPVYTAKVVECFVKLTDGIGDDNIYIQTKEAKTILKAGLESTDENVCQNAKHALDNLLREGRFDLLDLEDSKA